ncbi:MAG: hypothetical protein LBK95_09380 [Bifidobacteriaceae bacterium]|jgi:hypothetical protein|nr:hypothetical protein [Bifidobacteriaceae bacterium]
MRLRRIGAVLAAGVLVVSAGACANGLGQGSAGPGQDGAEGEPTGRGEPTGQDEPTGESWNADAWLDALANDGINDPATGEAQKELLRRFLEERTIGEADWKEANSRYVSCMAAKGYTAEVQYLGETTQVLQDAPMDADEAYLEGSRMADQDCAAAESAYVNSVYSEINRPGGPMDPQETDRSIRQCYIDKGIIPEDVTFEQWLAEGQKYLDMSNGNEEAQKCIEDAPW